MNGVARRRRALVLLSLALASGGLAASQVRGAVTRVEARVGRPVPVVVARRDLRPDERLRGRDLAVRVVPQRFVPRDALDSAAATVGLRTAAAIPAGGYVTAGALQSGVGRSSGPPRPGERAVEVGVAGGEALSGAAAPGSRVDVLVSTEERSGAGRTFLALEGAELLALRAGGDADASEGGAGAHASATATLRVTLRQAVYLTAAQNYAREIRLLPRPPGDRKRIGPAPVSANDL